MPIVYPKVSDLDTLADLLAWPATEGPVNRIQIERSTTGGGVGFANIGSKTLVADTLDYTFYDVTGITSDYYRWYFSNAANSFPTAGQREYTPEVQPGDASAGLLCSVFDVKQELEVPATNDTADESILGKIAQVSTAIMGFTHRRFARTPASGTREYLFDIDRATRILRVPQGIAAITALEAATSSQPTTGGVYATVPTTDWFPRPLPAERDYGWPATSVHLNDRSGSMFYPGYNTVRATMALGWEAVPEDIKGVCIRAVVRRYIGKGGGGAAVAIGPEGTEILLPDLSGSDRRVLEFYKHLVAV